MEKMRFKSKTGEIKQTFLCELVIKFVENFGRQLQISCLSVTRLKAFSEIFMCSFLCREGADDDSDI